MYVQLFKNKNMYICMYVCICKLLYICIYIQSILEMIRIRCNASEGGAEKSRNIYRMNNFARISKEFRNCK